MVGEATDPQFDSGWTPDEIFSMLEQLPRGTWGGDDLYIALTIGLLDGDVIETSERGTVLLSTPRAISEARLKEVHSLLSQGMGIDAAIDAAAERHPFGGEPGDFK